MTPAPQTKRRSLFEKLRQLIDSPLGALLGGGIYGSWATFANLVAGLHAAIRIGLTHFAMTSALTWFGVGLMNRLFGLTRDPRAGAVMAFCGSIAMTYTLLVSVHLAIGTPNILLTLTPGFLPTFAFTSLYSLLLLRQARSGIPAHAPTPSTV